MEKKKNWGNLLENLFVVIMAFYPLRHIGVGIDFCDTGYNYANFQYMGIDHMDPMWLFSTYLANVAGNMLTRLPRADTLLGMNLYTGLTVSILGLMGYFFCTRKLGMPKWITFVGEMMAISLCWCPTALLYNYLTYIFFLGSCILLYLGLTKEEAGQERQRFYLAGAGVLLGLNVLVRFSNLPEAAMIAAVWAYDFILWLEEKKEGKARRDQGRRGGFWPRVARHTFWCLLGYLAALFVMLGHIHLRYGLGEYVAGIERLFAMTENASDYKATSMLMGIVTDYLENLYWVVRIGIIVAGGMVMFWIADKLSGFSKIASILQVSVRVLWAAVCGAMLVWLYKREFCSLLFYSYDPIRRPCILFLMLTMLIGVIRIFHKNAPKEEKLISGMLILVILLTSIGSNNRTFPSWNNLFVAAPYTLWECWRFVRGRHFAWAKSVLFPVKAVLLTFLSMCLFQAAGFGAGFVFAESTGVRDATAYVENNEVLKNIRMNPERVKWMTELSAFANANDFRGKEVILYGDIPAVSYYLQMPSVFNPWSDLRSYHLSAMEEDMAQLEEEMEQKTGARPVILVENNYALYEESAVEGLRTAGVGQKKIDSIQGDQKWQLIVDFMDKYHYRQVFRNEKFAVYW